jgi:hypothetical protein
MRNLRCVIWRHDWQVKQDKEGRPYEICSRPGCYRVRDHSRSDGPYRHSDKDLPLPPHAPTDGGAGGAAGAGW